MSKALRTIDAEIQCEHCTEPAGFESVIETVSRRRDRRGEPVTFYHPLCQRHAEGFAQRHSVAMPEVPA